MKASGVKDTTPIFSFKKTNKIQKKPFQKKKEEKKEGVFSTP
jgi:hypothetical protein